MATIGWLKAKVNLGQFPGEYAVVTSTSDGQVISLFAPDSVVDANRNLVLVEILDSADDSALVYLPAQPFEISSQTVKVPKRELVAA